MDKPNCVINPKTNRAVKADSKLGKQILASQKKNVKKESNQMYKKPIGPVKPKELNQMYKKPIYPKKSLKPDYTKEGYFEDKIDLYNFLKSLVNLKPEVKNLYKKHKLDISTFIKKIHEMDKRIPPTSLLLEKLDYEWIDEFFKIFGPPPRKKQNI